MCNHFYLHGLFVMLTDGVNLDSKSCLKLLRCSETIVLLKVLRYLVQLLCKLFA